MSHTASNSQIVSIGIAPAGNALVLDLEQGKAMESSETLIASLDAFLTHDRTKKNWYVALPPAHAVPAPVVEYFNQLKERFREEGRRLCLHFSQNVADYSRSTDIAHETGAELAAV